MEAEKKHKLIAETELLCMQLIDVAKKYGIKGLISVAVNSESYYDVSFHGEELSFFRFADDEKPHIYEKEDSEDEV